MLEDRSLSEPYPKFGLAFDAHLEGPQLVSTGPEHTPTLSTKALVADFARS